MRVGMNFATIFGILSIGALIFTASFAPYLSPYDPNEQRLTEGLAGPSADHPLGQDKLGRDILSRIIYGARVSVLVGLVAIGASSALGVALGATAGSFGGIVDELIMRTADIFLAFPGILLAIAIMAVMGPGLGNVIFALVVMGWVGYARLVRGQILSLREREYVMAAESMGARQLRIMARHLLPNSMAPVIVEATFGMAAAIMAEAGLSFLGLGAQPQTPSWGSMLNEGRQFMLLAPHMTIFPGLAIMAVVLGLNFLGDGLRDSLDPTLRGAGPKERFKGLSFLEKELSR